MKEYDLHCQIQNKVEDAGVGRPKLYFSVSVSDHLCQEHRIGSIKKPRSWAQCQKIYVNLTFSNFETSSHIKNSQKKENILRGEESVTIITTKFKDPLRLEPKSTRNFDVTCL